MSGECSEELKQSILALDEATTISGLGDIMRDQAWDIEFAISIFVKAAIDDMTSEQVYGLGLADNWDT